MSVLSIPHRARIELSLFLAAAAGLALFFEGTFAPWACVAAMACIVWIWFERQEIHVDGKVITLTRTLFGKRLGPVQTMDASTGVSAILSILLPRRALPRQIRRIAFRRQRRIIAWTRDLPPDIEVALMASLNEHAGMRVLTVEAGGSFRPKIRRR